DGDVSALQAAGLASPLQSCPLSLTHQAYVGLSLAVLMQAPSEVDCERKSEGSQHKPVCACLLANVAISTKHANQSAPIACFARINPSRLTLRVQPVDDAAASP